MQISINQLNQSYKVSLLSITILLFFSDFCTLLPAYQVTPTSKCKYILPCSIWKFMWEKVDVLLLSRRREKVISYFIKYVDEMDALSFAWDTTQWCFQYLFLGMSNNNHPHTGCSLLASSRRWYKKEAGGWVRKGILVVTKKSLLLLRKLQSTVDLYWVCILHTVKLFKNTYSKNQVFKRIFIVWWII